MFEYLNIEERIQRFVVGFECSECVTSVDCGCSDQAGQYHTVHYSTIKQGTKVRHLITTYHTWTTTDELAHVITV